MGHMKQRTPAVSVGLRYRGSQGRGKFPSSAAAAAGVLCTTTHHRRKYWGHLTRGNWWRNMYCVSQICWTSMDLSFSSQSPVSYFEDWKMVTTIEILACQYTRSPNTPWLWLVKAGEKIIFQQSVQAFWEIQYVYHYAGSKESINKCTKRNAHENIYITKTYIFAADKRDKSWWEKKDSYGWIKTLGGQKKKCNCVITTKTNGCLCIISSAGAGADELPKSTCEDSLNLYVYYIYISIYVWSIKIKICGRMRGKKKNCWEDEN
jgi:hypothetical protein